VSGQIFKVCGKSLIANTMAKVDFSKHVQASALEAPILCGFSRRDGSRDANFQIWRRAPTAAKAANYGSSYGTAEAVP
jgi:hypothetical protein